MWLRILHYLGLTNLSDDQVNEYEGLRRVKPLIAALKDPDESVRWRAAEVLGQLGDGRAIEPLVDAVLKDPNNIVRWHIAETLEQLGDGRAVEPLIAALKDPDGSVRRRAAEVLGQLRDGRAVEPLIAAALQDVDPELAKLRTGNSISLPELRHSSQTLDFAERPILVPVDFSSCSKSALVFASYFANRIESPLLILYVVRDSSITKPGFYHKRSDSNRMLPLDKLAGGRVEDFIDELRNEQSELNDMHTIFSVLNEARIMIVRGLPEERIPQVAIHEDAAMIIMGSHGREGIARLLLGSVAEKVTKYSKVPVTIIREPRERGSLRIPDSIDSIEASILVRR